MHSLGWWAVDGYNDFQRFDLKLLLVVGPLVVDVSPFELYGRGDERAVYIFSSTTHPQAQPPPRLLQH